MSYRYNAQQTTAFRVVDTDAWNRDYHLLRFPERWKTPLLELSSRNSADYNSIPIRSLNNALTALIPDVITVATSATRGAQPPWIYAENPIDPRAVYPIITAWVRAQRADNPGLTERALSRMSADDLQWQQIQVDFAAAIRRTTTSTTHPGGDQVPIDTVFRLLPHELAARLTAEGMECLHWDDESEDGEGERDEDGVAESISRFRRCPTTEWAQIMSWPPHPSAAKPFSFMIDLSAQTRPFDAEAQIYAHVGARRWAHRTPSLDTSTRSNVYFLPSVAWLPDVGLTRSFHKAPIRLEIIRDGSGRPAPRARWDGLAAKVIEQLGVHSRIEMPEQIRRNPKAFLDREAEPAGLVFRNGMYTFPNKPAGKHPVAPGASVKDRRRIIEWIADSTDGALRLTDQCPRNPVIAIPGLHLPKVKKEPAVGEGSPTAAALRASIKQATGVNRLLVEVYYDTTATLTSALETLEQQLGVKLQIPEPIGNQKFEAASGTPELEITVRVEPIGALAADLDTNPRFKSTIERLQAAVERRAEAITLRLADTPVPPQAVAVALIEIGGKASYAGKQREKDPKFALRHGFAKAGRLTQFITPPSPAADTAVKTGQDQAETTADRPKSDPRAETLHSCWRDLWRQLGARSAPIPPSISGLTGTRFLAFYVIRQNRTRVWGATRKVPIAVLMNGDGSNIRVKGPLMDDFAPLHQAVLQLSRAHVMGRHKYTPEQVTGFYSDVLNKDVDTMLPTLLLTIAHNLRSIWTFLQNSSLVPDAIAFAPDDLLPISEYPGLRHVRVRTDQSNETPEGYAVNDTEQGHAPGTWQLTGDRVFISTAEKPPTALKAVKDRSKVEARTFTAKSGDNVVEDPKLSAMVWNHQLVELTAAALQEGDEAAAWAALAHDLRWAAPHYTWPTVLPWPLHLARTIGEYILPIQLIEEIENPDDDRPEPRGAQSFIQMEIDFTEDDA